MFLRIAAMALGLGLAGQAAAATNNAPPLRKICRQQLPLVREEWLTGAFDAPPAVDTLMVDVIDGKLRQVRQQLQQMNPAAAHRWRQRAMIAAAWAGQPAVVDGLLDDGALVDGSSWTTPFKPAFFQQLVGGVKRDPRWGGPTVVKKMLAIGALTNRRRSTGPALMGAVTCGDAATVDVLLRHHVNIAQREGPDIADALEQATVDGDAPIAQRLLDHGADPCVSDRVMARNHVREPAIPVHTMALVGTHAKLPAALVARLTCPAVTATH